MTEWISVEDRLPPLGETVLVFIASHRRITPHCRIALDTWDEIREDPLSMGGATIVIGEGWGDWDFEDITHWMPLPEMPK